MSGTRASRRPLIGAALALTAALAILAVLAGTRQGWVVTEYVGNIGNTLVMIASAVTCALAAKRAGRAGWAVLAAGLFLYGVATGLVTFGLGGEHYENFYLVGLPLQLIGLAALATGQRASDRVRLGLDGAIIASALLVAGLTTVFAPTLTELGGSGWWEWTKNLAYPVGDVGMLSVALILLGSMPRAARLHVVLLAAGCLLNGAMDVAFAVFSQYVPDASFLSQVSLLDVGWLAGGGALMLAGLAAPARTPAGVKRPVAPHSTVSQYLPYPSVVVAYLAAVGVYVAEHRISPLVFFGCTVLTAMVLSRQLIVLKDNRGLLAELEHRAHHDPLTQLANRALFELTVERCIDVPARGAQTAILYIDLDGFKAVNDTAGHAAGDALLVSVADKLQLVAREEEARVGDIARLGGDEFALVFNRLNGPEDAQRLAARLIEEIGIIGTTTPSPVTASVGVAMHRPGMPLGELLRAADLAMYEAKSAGKNQFRLAGEQRTAPGYVSERTRAGTNPVLAGP